MNYSDDNEHHSAATHRANQIIQQMEGKKPAFAKYDYSTLIGLMCFVCHSGVQIKEQSHMIVHQLAGQKLCLFQKQTPFI